MRRIAVMNQKGGVGKTTTCANLGAALARAGRRVVVIDMDPQANLTLFLGAEPNSDAPSAYSVLSRESGIQDALVGTNTPGLSLVPSHIDLSGAELELAGTIGRETILTEVLDAWEDSGDSPPADYVIIDCPPSLGLLSVNALVAAREVIIALQTEFFALQGMSKLIEIVQLLKRRMNPDLTITGILPCLYDSRLRLAREVLAEIRRYFPGQVFSSSIRTNVKLAESPSYGQTIFEYAPDSNGAKDHERLAREVVSQEERDPELAARFAPAERANEAAAAAPAEDEDLFPHEDGGDAVLDARGVQELASALEELAPEPNADEPEVAPDPVESNGSPPPTPTAIQAEPVPAEDIEEPEPAEPAPEQPAEPVVELEPQPPPPATPEPPSLPVYSHGFYLGEDRDRLPARRRPVARRIQKQSSPLPNEGNEA